MDTRSDARGGGLGVGTLAKLREERTRHGVRARERESGNLWKDDRIADAWL